MGTLSLLKDVGVTWFREEDYPVLLEIFDDADKMPRTWKEWLMRAEQMEERAKAQGYQHSAFISIPIVSSIGVCAKG
jgi:hypothetical protein